MRSAAWAGVAVPAVIPHRELPTEGPAVRAVEIAEVDSNFEREPLLHPFGFKGSYITELWQSVMFMRSASGTGKAGLATQSVLWSDASVFASHSESGGNALMYAMSEYALNLLKGARFDDPVSLLDSILEEVYGYGQRITGKHELRKTFALNALVGVDNAAWLLYAAENGITGFDGMIPPEYRPALSRRHEYVAAIPLISYNVPVNEVEQAVSAGYFFLKIKIGQPGSQEEMLRRDIERLSAIHKAVGLARTPHTRDGRLRYYLDANGRYEKKETLLKLIDHLRVIGALGQVAVIEEPFPEEIEVDVRDIPVRLAADESAHTDKEALARMEMGYGAIALKAIAKTLSMTLKIAGVARERRVPCFCADLTVNPILVDWNRNVAARLEPFPGLEGGLLETNGHQNYANWKQMEQYHPFPDSSWRRNEGGIFHLGEDFYRKSGGILTDSAHYMDTFRAHG